MTKKRVWTIIGIVFGVFVVGVFVLALLGPAVGNVYSTTVSSYAPGAPPQRFAQETSGRGFVVEEAVPLGTMVPAPASGGNLAQPTVPQQRLIIRTASLSLVVSDTRAAIDEITGMTETMSGFVVSSNIYQMDESALGGNITVRVPAERLEEALGRLRSMAVEVSSESISGEDVTEEYVDLQARLESLKAAEQRLLEIMTNAQNTSDLLEAEAQLTTRQAEIEALEGRMQYLEQSAAMSRIDVNLTPDIIAQPVDVGWKPLRTVRRAFDALVRGLTGIVDAAIFIVIAILPPLLLIALLVAPFFFLGRAIWRRRRRRQ